MRIAALLNHHPVPALQWVEVSTSLQIPSFTIIGLPSPEVAEARERIRAAIDASGLSFPRRRVVVNLSPASVRKRGTGLDLAMALAVLGAPTSPNAEASGPTLVGMPPLGADVSAADGQDESVLLSAAEPAVAVSNSRSIAAWGELGLDGSVKPTGQTTRALYAAWAAGVPRLMLPREELGLARERVELIRASGELPGEPPRLLAVSTLSEAWWLLAEPDAKEDRCDEHSVDSCSAAAPAPGSSCTPGLLALPLSLERTIGVAASGGHHLLLLGPRGTGKSHALEWLIALQPDAEPEVRLRLALLGELAGDACAGAGAGAPVRKVGAHVKAAALVGGAGPDCVRPGEFTLAHGGLLVADELPEWCRDSREALREPLERGIVTLTRAKIVTAAQSLELPARFALAANGNLCPCGGWPAHLPTPPGVEEGGRRPPRCQCRPSQRESYLARLSGPILDRVDLVLVVGHNPSRKARTRRAALADAAHVNGLRQRVTEARRLAIGFWGLPPARLSADTLEAILARHPEWQASLDPASFSSLRSRHKVMRVALTLAAWDGKGVPDEAHFLEAACYRPERFGLCD